MFEKRLNAEKNETKNQKRRCVVSAYSLFVHCYQSHTRPHTYIVISCSSWPFSENKTIERKVYERVRKYVHRFPTVLRLADSGMTPATITTVTNGVNWTEVSQRSADWAWCSSLSVPLLCFVAHYAPPPPKSHTHIICPIVFVYLLLNEILHVFLTKVSCIIKITTIKSALLALAITHHVNMLMKFKRLVLHVTVHQFTCKYSLIQSERQVYQNSQSFGLLAQYKL